MQKMYIDKTQTVWFNYPMMMTLTDAKQTAEQTLAAYEKLGRELPEDMGTWTSTQRLQMLTARDAYFAALTDLNALRGANGEA